jgi:hypothetical protein
LVASAEADRSGQRRRGGPELAARMVADAGLVLNLRASPVRSVSADGDGMWDRVLAHRSEQMTPPNARLERTRSDAIESLAYYHRKQ